MHPILFQFGPFTVYSYGVAVACAFIVAFLLLRRDLKQESLPAEKISDLAIYVVISGILGARLFYVLQNLPFYLKFPGQILMLHKGGLSFYGGLILAAICAIIFFKKHRLPAFKMLDLICPYLALGQAIGRIGCFLNGCCYGKPTDSMIGVIFPGEELLRYPTQIYSSLGLLAIYGLLRVFQVKRRRRFPGQTFLLYCLLYSGFRFFIEYLRGDNLRIWANLTIHQLISAAIFIAALIIWQKQWRSSS